MEAKDNLSQKLRGGAHYDLAVDPVNFPIQQGSLVFYDVVNNLTKPVTSDADAATLLGCATKTIPFASNLGNGVTPVHYDMEAAFGDAFKLNTTTGETYVNFQEVYVGADSQTITNTAGLMTHPVGYIRLPSNVASVAGAAGVKVPVVVYTRTPSLNF